VKKSLFILRGVFYCPKKLLCLKSVGATLAVALACVVARVHGRATAHKGNRKGCPYIIFPKAFLKAHWVGIRVNVGWFVGLILLF
jgi:hypothetical protein